MKYYSSNAKKIENWKFIQTKQILDEILTETKKNPKGYRENMKKQRKTQQQKRIELKNEI